LGQEQPFWLLRPFKVLDGELPSITEMAHEYVALLKEAGFKGPICLSGLCNGALIAHEVARQAEAAGMPVECVILIDPISLNARLPLRLLAWTFTGAFWLLEREPARRHRRLANTMSRVWGKILTINRRLSRPRNELGESRGPERPGAEPGPLDDDLERRHQTQSLAYFGAMAAHVPRRINARLACFVTKSSFGNWQFASHVWKDLGSSLTVAVVPGEHLTCVTTHLEALVERMRAALTGRCEHAQEITPPSTKRGDRRGTTRRSA
jgi:thioesterase domain-containing protein